MIMIIFITMAITTLYWAGPEIHVLKAEKEASIFLSVGNDGKGNNKSCRHTPRLIALLQFLKMLIKTISKIPLKKSAGCCGNNRLSWWMCMNIMNNYIVVFFIFLLLYRIEATGVSHIIVLSVPPYTENISHQQLTLVLRPLRVEFSHLLRCIYNN